MLIRIKINQQNNSSKNKKCLFILFKKMELNLRNKKK